jgi:tRNA (adenine57-N1/adenine58-N1)-methyltransferase
MNALRESDWVVVSDRRGHKNLFRLAAGERLHTSDGYVACDEIIGQHPGTRLRTSKGAMLAVFRATLEEYVSLMPRAAQIVTPKDVAMITQWADVGPGSVVVEAGLGSGALTLGLLRAVGEGGRVISFELREEFANRARKNVEGWGDAAERFELRLADVHTGLGELRHVDSVVLDLQDPWQALDGAAQALVPGGILVCYVPSVRQVDQLVVALWDHPEFATPEVCETILRPWLADKIRLRPESRIMGHTGFLIRSRHLLPS